MKNPCELCLIRPMCLIPCDKLNEYTRYVVKIEEFDKIPNHIKYWMDYHELRPHVVRLYYIEHARKENEE